MSHLGPETWRETLAELAALFPGHACAASRAGVEQALVDALAVAARTPLWRLFGGAGFAVTSDITVRTVVWMKGRGGGGAA